ncbi:MAG: hypothetical protein HWN67_02390 [Candidatus Helarchaeota archaeon]|nr:hypothetical protein [Candidatus Helarchaeota archaeon]
MLAEDLKQKLKDFEIFFMVDEHFGTKITQELDKLGTFGVAYKTNNNKIQKIEWFKNNAQDYEMSDPKEEEKFVFHDRIQNIIDGNEKIRKFSENLSNFWGLNK